MIRTIAIDDEPLALQLVTGYISKTPFLELAGSFDNPVSAMEFIEQEPVDLIFLDIQMPDLTGTEFARLLHGGQKIVFTTAYEKYALEGFRLDGIAQKVHCPVLMTHGTEDEQVPLEDAHKLFAAIGSKDKTLRIFDAAEGGAQHCQRDYLTLVAAVMGDWLSEKL